MIFKLAELTTLKTDSSIFTFQSGDIQIGKDKKFEELYDLFTFQSGDIQINYSDMQNMLSSKIFTFQSGDIQILGLCQKYIMTLFIYIPIW